MFIPEGFTPIKETLKVKNVNNTPRLTFLKNVDGMNIYEIETKKEWYAEERFNPEGNNNKHIEVKLDIEAGVDVEE